MWLPARSLPFFGVITAKIGSMSLPKVYLVGDVGDDDDEAQRFLCRFEETVHVRSHLCSSELSAFCLACSRYCLVLCVREFGSFDTEF